MKSPVRSSCRHMFRLDTFRLTVTVPVQPFVSVPFTVIEKVPPCVAVPDSSPAVLRCSPVGNVLAVVNVTAPTPPLCVNCTWYGSNSTATGTVVGVTLIVEQPIDIVYPLLPVQLCESVAVTVIGKVPVAVGVPDSTPAVLRVNPSRDPVSANVTVPTPPVWVNGVDVYAE